MSIYRFPGAYVWQRKLPNHEEIKARVLPKILAAAEANEDNVDFKWSLEDSSTVVTNYVQERTSPWAYFTPEDVQEIALGSAYEFAASNSIPDAEFPDGFVIRTFWWNRYLPGATAPPHVHSGCISGVYLLEQTERCPLEFFDLNMYSPDPEKPSTNYWPEVEEGTVLLFPGTLTHWVRPATAPRTTVSFNLGRRPD